MRVAGVELQGLVAFLEGSSSSLLGWFQGVLFVESILGWLVTVLLICSQSYSQVSLAHHNVTPVTHLKALYAEEAEVLVQFSPCLLRLAEVFFQMYLHLLSAV